MFPLAVQLARLCDRQGIAAVGAAWVGTAVAEAPWGIAVGAEQHTVGRKLVVGMGVKLVVVERLRVLPHEFERGTWYCPQG